MGNRTSASAGRVTDNLVHWGDEKLLSGKFFLPSSHPISDFTTESGKRREEIKLKSLKYFASHDGIIDSIAYSIKEMNILFLSSFFSSCVEEEEYNTFAVYFKPQDSDELLTLSDYRSYEKVIEYENLTKHFVSNNTNSRNVIILQTLYKMFIRHCKSNKELLAKVTKRKKDFVEMLIRHVGLFNLSLCWIVKDQKKDSIFKDIIKKSYGNAGRMMNYAPFGRYHVGISLGVFYAHFCKDIVTKKGFVDVFSRQEKAILLGKHFLDIPLMFIVPDQEIIDLITSECFSGYTTDYKFREIAAIVYSKVYQCKNNEKMFSLLDFVKTFQQAINYWKENKLDYGELHNNCQHFFFYVVNELEVMEIKSKLPYQYFYFDLFSKRLVKSSFSSSVYKFMDEVWKVPEGIHFKEFNQVKGSHPNTFIEFIRNNELSDFDPELLKIAFSFYLRRSKYSEESKTVSKMVPLNESEKVIIVSQKKETHIILRKYIDVVVSHNIDLRKTIEDFNRSEEMDSVMLKKVIGTGGYATVYKIDLGTSVYAFKNFKIQKDIETTIDNILTISKMLLTLSHKNIIRFKGYSLESPEMKGRSRMGIITEFCKYGSVKKYVQGTKLSSLTTKLDLLIQVADGMNFLHKAKIMHRDLKWENVLLREDNSIAICDFGTSKKFAEYVNKENTKRQGSLWYIDPEIYTGKYSPSVDVFSFAIMIYSLLTNNFSLGDVFYKNEKEIVMNPNKRPEYYKNDEEFLLLLTKIDVECVIQDERDLASLLLEMMTMCWNPLSEKRPKFSDILVVLKDIRNLHLKKRGGLFNVLQFFQYTSRSEKIGKKKIFVKNLVSDLYKKFVSKPFIKVIKQRPIYFSQVNCEVEILEIEKLFIWELYQKKVFLLVLDQLKEKGFWREYIHDEKGDNFIEEKIHQIFQQFDLDSLQKFMSLKYKEDLNEFKKSEDNMDFFDEELDFLIKNNGEEEINKEVENEDDEDSYDEEYDSQILEMKRKLKELEDMKKKKKRMKQMQKSDEENEDVFIYKEKLL